MDLGRGQLCGQGTVWRGHCPLGPGSPVSCRPTIRPPLSPKVCPERGLSLPLLLTPVPYAGCGPPESPGPAPLSPGCCALSRPTSSGSCSSWGCCPLGRSWGWMGTGTFLGHHDQH